MKLLRPKNALICMIILVMLILAQHAFHFWHNILSIGSILASAGVMVFAFLYYIQIAHVLNVYYSVKGIKTLCWIIGSAFVFQYLGSLNVRIMVYNYMEGELFEFVRMLAAIFYYVLATVLIVCFIILGKKLLDVKGYPEVSKLGLCFLIGVPAYIAVIQLLYLIPAYRILAHILLPVELLPYWFSWKIYRDAMSAQQQPSAFETPGTD